MIVLRPNPKIRNSVNERQDQKHLQPKEFGKNAYDDTSFLDLITGNRNS